MPKNRHETYSDRQSQASKAKKQPAAKTAPKTASKPPQEPAEPTKNK